MEPLTREEKTRLLEIAREAIEARLRHGPYAPSDPESEALREPAGAFVTLHAGDRLRGCIGALEARGPLYQTVAEMARCAACEDPRFPPLGLEELPKVDVEISVLTPLRPVSCPEEIQVGRDGLYIVKGHCRGVLLPQVASERGWDRETFLAETCRKAGLPRDAWRQGAEIRAFEACVFGEKG